MIPKFFPDDWLLVIERQDDFSVSLLITSTDLCLTVESSVTSTVLSSLRSPVGWKLNCGHLLKVKDGVHLDASDELHQHL